MLKRFTIFVLMILMTAGCYNFKTPIKPKNLISKDEMVKVLIDINLLKTATIKYANTTSKKNINPQQYIFDKYGIDSTQFASSNNYYSYYLDEYEVIYIEVKDSLEKLLKYYEDLEVFETKEKAKKDSLNRLKPKDSLSAVRRRNLLRAASTKDSLNQTDLEEEIEKGLIEPVSDKDFQ